MGAMATGRSLGTAIRRARERRRWTQRQLADALSVSVRTVNDWENDRTSPRSSIGALEEVLSVDLSVGDPERPAIDPELMKMINELGPEDRAYVVELLTEPGAGRDGEAGARGQPRRAAG